jgi:hypothetical protein
VIALTRYWWLRIRILLLLAVFYVLHEYTKPVFGWMFVLFFLFGDMADLDEDIKTILEEKDSWKNFLIRRERF